MGVVEKTRGWWRRVGDGEKRWKREQPRLGAIVVWYCGYLVVIITWGEVVEQRGVEQLINEFTEGMGNQID